MSQITFSNPWSFVHLLAISKHGTHSSIIFKFNFLKFGNSLSFRSLTFVLTQTVFFFSIWACPALIRKNRFPFLFSLLFLNRFSLLSLLPLSFKLAFLLAPPTFKVRSMLSFFHPILLPLRWPSGQGRGKNPTRTHHIVRARVRFPPLAIVNINCTYFFPPPVFYSLSYLMIALNKIKKFFVRCGNRTRAYLRIWELKSHALTIRPT